MEEDNEKQPNPLEDLPIFRYKEKIINVIKDNLFCVITGDTGSGKSTQLPQYIYDSEEIFNDITKNNKDKVFGKDRLNIVVTQPRKIAAISMAKRVCYERKIPFGEEISYTIRFDDRCTERTRMRYVTDGILVRECLSDGTLSKYNVVVLDEAHERSIYTDILFALVKKAVLIRGGSLKLIVTSATLNIEQFCKYFNNCPFLKVEGRCYPVDIMYGHVSSNRRIEESVKAAIRMHLHEGPGDVLVFLAGSEDCEAASRLCFEKLQELANKGKEVPPMVIYPLYGAQSSEDQARVFEPAPEGARKLVFATNIAETSITINGIGFVVDSGYVKQKNYNPRTGMDALLLVPISRVQAIQRAGRAGRTQPGKCYRMYSEQFFNEQMIESTVPEILRVNLSSSLLTLKSMGIHDVVKFEYMEPPNREAIIGALKQLYLLSAIDADGKILPLGLEMSKFPLEPSYAKALMSSMVMDCQDDMLTIVSILSTENIWSKVSRHNEKLYDEFLYTQKKLAHDDGDHITYINIYKKWAKKGYSDSWCNDNFLSIRALRQAQSIKGQLRDLIPKIDMKVCKECLAADPICKMYFDSKSDKKNLSKQKSNLEESKTNRSDSYKYNSSELVRMALCTGFYFNSARRVAHSESEYLLLSEGNIVSVDPNCVFSLRERFPPYVIFTELGGTSIVRGVMRIVSEIKQEWVSEYKDNLKGIDGFRLAGLEHTLSNPNSLLNKRKNPNEQGNGVDEETLRKEKAEEAKKRYLERKQVKKT